MVTKLVDSTRNTINVDMIAEKSVALKPTANPKRIARRNVFANQDTCESEENASWARLARLSLVQLVKYPLASSLVLNFVTPALVLGWICASHARINAFVLMARRD